jgi:hypothetical protein
MPRPCRVGAERDHSQMRIAPCRRGRPYVSSARTGTEFRRIVHGQPRRGDPRHDQETAGLSAFGDFGSVGTMRLGRLAMDAVAPFEPSAPRLVFEASTMRWRRRKRARRSSMGADRPGASPPRSAPFRPDAGERGVGRRLRLIGEPVLNTYMTSAIFACKACFAHSQIRAHRPCACAHHVWPGESALRYAPIPRQSGRLDGAVCHACLSGGSRSSTSAAPPRRTYGPPRPQSQMIQQI